MRPMSWVDRHRAIVIALVVVLGGGVVLWFWFSDEAPTELAVQWSAPLPRPPEAENGFPLLAGMGAAVELDAAIEGKKWVDAIAEQIADATLGVSLSAVPSPSGLTAFDAKDWCAWPRTDCLRWTLDRREQVKQLLAVHATLLDRYEQLFRYPVFTEQIIFRIDVPFPQYHHVVNAARLHHARAYLDFADGRKPRAIESTAASIKLARRLVATSHSLIQKMIAVAVLNHSTASLSELLRADPTAAVIHSDRVDAALTPLTQAEKDMAATVRAEFQYSDHLLRDPCRYEAQSGDGFDVPGCNALHLLFYRP